MKQLKKYLLYTLPALLMLFSSSCSDWLDYTPKDKETDDITFSSREGFYATINGVYNRLGSTSLYGKNLTYGMLEVMGRRYAVTNQNSLYNFVAQAYTQDNAAALLDNVWSEAYATILNCNVILDNLEEKRNTVLSEVDYSLMKGEMLALRAFLHFDMLRLFGPVYKLSPTDARVPYNNTSEAKTYDLLPADKFINDYLLPDLTEAENLLAQHDPVLTEGPLASTVEDTENYQRYRQLRLNYYAVALLKARVHLWAGDKANALAEAQKITDDAKVQTFFPFVDANKLLGNGIDPDRMFSTESLFGLYVKAMSDIYTYNFAASLSANVILRPRSGYIGLLFTDAGDYRNQSQWSNATGGSEFVKYKSFTVTDESKSPFHRTFFPLMRLSEAYYIAAEAIMDSDKEKACQYLSTIKAARGVAAVSADITPSELMLEIEREYLRETYGEGQSFFLFKRLYLGFKDEFNGYQDPWSDYASTTRYVVPLPESENINR